MAPSPRLPLISLTLAAELLGVSWDTVARRARSGGLGAIEYESLDGAVRHLVTRAAVEAERQALRATR